MFRNTRARAKKAGIPFTIVKEDILSVLEKGRCTVTDLPFDLHSHPIYRCNPFSPSVDRIDPTQGYIQGNIQVTVNIYNQAKCAYQHGDVMVLADALIRKAVK